MDRRERRRRTRERKKLEEKLRKEGLRSATDPPASSQSRLRRVFRPGALGGLAGGALALLGGWAVIRPHISVEPYIPLNPIDPYTTQFTVKNENALFEAHDINCVCWPRRMESSNRFSVLSLGPLPNVHHQIRALAPGASATVDCPPIIGGLGSYAGQVQYAELEIEVSYSQSWWPFGRGERFPFVSKRDVQGAVHWVHITPEEEKPLVPAKN